jgi:ubiquinol-cytochrome c reductase cytochrome c1 subunit
MSRLATNSAALTMKRTMKAFTHSLARSLALLLGGILLAVPAAYAEDEPQLLAFTASANPATLQRGARDFMAYCSGCHSLKYLRYNRMAEDLGISADLLKANLIFDGSKPGELIQTAMPAQQSETWFGRTPPDLTLETKARGADWVYSYLLGFYLDSSRPLGVNNLYLPGASMPAVLGEACGYQAKVEAKGGKEGEGEALPLKTVVPGSMDAAQCKAFVSDLTSFMAYAAEPVAREREHTGWHVVFYLLFLLIPLSYALKKEFWRDVH